MKSFRILDTWHVAAMRATGSNGRRTSTANSCRSSRGCSCRLAGRHGGGIEGKCWPALSHSPADLHVARRLGPLVGAAEAMFELVAETMRTKVRAYSLAQNAATDVDARAPRRTQMRTGCDARLLRSEDRFRRKQGRCWRCDDVRGTRGDTGGRVHGSQRRRSASSMRLHAKQVRVRTISTPRCSASSATSTPSRRMRSSTWT